MTCSEYYSINYQTKVVFWVTFAIYSLEFHIQNMLNFSQSSNIQLKYCITIMNITNNNQPSSSATYQKPLIFIRANESNRSSRSNSFNSNKQKKLPIVYNSPNHKNIQMPTTANEGSNTVRLSTYDKKVGYMQQKNENKQLVYPPPLPVKQFQKVIVRPSNKQFIVNNSRPHSKSSHHGGSSIQNRPQRSISSNYSNHIHQQYNDRRLMPLPRQRTQSSYSSKSSTKIIIQTVRPLQTGSNQAPLFHTIHHTFQTQFNNPRKNYHLPDRNDISSNHHQVRINNNNNNIYNSPQLPHRIYQSPPQAQHFMNPNKVYQNNSSNGKNQKKVQFSQVFQYPLKQSTDIRNSIILETQQSQITNRYNKNSSKQQGIHNYPITSQSKIFEGKNTEKSNLNKQQKFSNTGKKQSFENTFNSTMHQNNGKNGQINNMGHYFQPRIQIKQFPVQTITSKQVFNSQSFYQSSRRMIDKIFEIQTEKAMLRMRSFDIQKNQSRNKKYIRNYHNLVQKR